ncbi:MAG TPA: hypothetical protein VKJ45_13960 [Blastocatellia bacterium]|nr:hypothetical protein [Blastocatellia bacterium]
MAGINEQWKCHLSASPNQVRNNAQVKLTVTLSDGPAFGALPPQDRIRVYKDGFTFKFSSPSNPELGTAVEEAYQSTSITSEPIQFSFTVPADILSGNYDIRVDGTPKDDAVLSAPPFDALPARNPVNDTTQISVTAPIETKSDVTLQRTFVARTDDAALGPAIRNRTAAIGFERYQRYINCIFGCDDTADPNVVGRFGAGGLDTPLAAMTTSCLDTKDTNFNDPTERRRVISIYGPYAYSVLKLATQVFLTLESGVVLRQGDPGLPKIFDIKKEQIRFNDSSLTFQRIKDDLQAYISPSEHLPYLDRIVRNLITLDPNNIHEVLPYCLGVLKFRLTSPSLIELIWSYWLEEGMLVQTMNAIARRFQNRRGSPNDPLGELEFDPLRPLNNLIWGFIQDEHNRLTVPRRAHEYQHHYGLSLIGTTVSDVNPADSRSKFIEAFHNLLSCAARFFKEDSDTTVIADAFPLLNALKEVHLILAEGAHNQFGDLTWTARAEMLTIQWMLARPEMREFLRGRYMVPYQEEWMGAVDSMKKLQGWTDTTITHFYELAVTGERILLSVRYGDWSDIENIEDQAKNWARSWKPEIQRYIHGYRTATGVDLAADITDTRDAATRYLQPSVLIQRRLTEQAPAMRLRAPSGPDLIEARVSRRAELATPARPRLPAYRKES